MSLFETGTELTQAKHLFFVSSYNLLTHPVVLPIDWEAKAISKIKVDIFFIFISNYIAAIYVF